MKEDNNFVSRVKRYSKVTTSLTSLATQFAGKKYLNFDLSDQKYAAQITEILGNLKGPLMKVAQLSATIPDLLPEEYARKLAELQSNAPPMSWVFVKRRMKAELGENWEDHFLSFDKEASFAASLGQVHKASLPNKDHVACKLQYPDMASAVQADLRQLKLIFSLYERYDKAISTSDIHTELAERLEEELDYRREAANMRLYRAMLDQVEGANVPETVDALSTQRLLTMTWLNGSKLKAFIEENEDQAMRNKVAENMFRTWYVPFYYYGVIHGDPHLGNYSIASDHRINLMDFGSIRLFRPEFVAGVIELYKALRDDDKAQAVDAYERWGFVGLDNEAIAHLLNGSHPTF